MTRPALILAALLTATAASAESPAEMFLAQWDLNADGKVTLEEATTRRADIFAMFDADGNGQFSQEEFATIDEHRTLEQEQMGGMAGMGMMGMGGARNGMARFDANGDGLISRDEFVSGTKIWFAMRDRSGDGVLTAADFGG